MHVAGQQLCDTNVAAMPRLRAAEGPAFAWPMRSMATPFVSIAPVPAIVESGVQHLDGCVVIGSIVHDDDAFRADRLGHPPAARAASRQWGGGALSPANADACVRARAWCGLWW